MAENSKIEWCHHTFNAWEGCEKVSDGCANCYAERRDRQYHGGEHWRPKGTRKMMSEAYWKQPLKWNTYRSQCQICQHWNHPTSKLCQKKDCPGTEENFIFVNRPRVFCSSLADVFEDRPELIDVRHRLMLLIESTPNLDWLLLTKRPENVGEMIPVKWFEGFPNNVWLGTTVENQEEADKRIPELLKIPARVRFLSCEPLLGDVNFQRQIRGTQWNLLTGEQKECGFGLRPERGIDWVITGGESGPNARPMSIDWVNSLRDQCLAADVPVFIKQMGSEYANRKGFADPKGGDWTEWAAEHRIRQFPNAKTA